jgi:hypothetical protein
LRFQWHVMNDEMDTDILNDVVKMHCEVGAVDQQQKFSKMIDVFWIAFIIIVVCTVIIGLP